MESVIVYRSTTRKLMRRFLAVYIHSISVKIFQSIAWNWRGNSHRLILHSARIKINLSLLVKSETIEKVARSIGKNSWRETSDERLKFTEKSKADLGPRRLFCCAMFSWLCELLLKSRFKSKFSISILGGQLKSKNGQKYVVNQYRDAEGFYVTRSCAFIYLVLFIIMMILTALLTYVILVPR